MIFGSFVVLVSARELYRLFGKAQPERPLGRLTTAGLIGSAGVIHGIYASGGPVLVYALGRLNLTKGVFRATLAAVWLIFNVVLTTVYAVEGKLAEPLTIARFLPIVLVGIVLGEALHHRVDERRFRIFVFLLLAFAGAALVIRS